MPIYTNSGLKGHLDAVASVRVLLAVNIIYIKCYVILLKWTTTASSKWVQLFKLRLFIVMSSQNRMTITAPIFWIAHTLD